MGYRGLVLKCPTTQDRLDYDPKSGCCSRRVLEEERGSRGQEGLLQGEVEALSHCVLFYPRSHCELNFIERYWCLERWFARGNCGYDLEALKATMLETLTNGSIRGFYRLTIDTYSVGVQYGTEEFTQIAYMTLVIRIGG